MIKRVIQQDVEDSLKKFPVVGILGCRQVGKTTLAKMIMQGFDRETVYLDLELPSDLYKLQDAELYLSSRSDALVIIDEIQRMPSLFPIIRSLVDRHNKTGRFLILGSASPSLIKQSSESLAGRIVYHELSPLTLIETGYEHIQRLWLRGGFPQSFLSENDADSFRWREAFIKTYLEMDIPQFGIRIPAQQLRRFWMMLAHLHGSLWNASKIAGSLGISAPTARHYLDILADSFIIRELQPHHANIKKRLIKSQRIYIRDTGLLHCLLNIADIEGLYGHPAIGSSWEGFVIEQILRQLPDRWQAYFYRTSAGAEIDLLLFNTEGEPIAIEVKHSLSPRVEKGFHSAYKDLNCKRGFIIYPGEESYPVSKDVYVLPIKEIGSILEQ